MNDVMGRSIVLTLLVIALLLIYKLIYWDAHKLGFWNITESWLKIRFIRWKTRQKLREDRRQRAEDRRAEKRRLRSERRAARRSESFWHLLPLSAWLWILYVGAVPIFIVTKIGLDIFDYRAIVEFFLVWSLVLGVGVIVEKVAGAVKKSVDVTTVNATLEKIPEHRRGEVERVIKLIQKEERQIEGPRSSVGGM